MCDTFLRLYGAGRLFAKNSDREPNEAQVVEYHPPGKYPAGAQLACTYVSVPQASRTRGVLLCRPFWMWGAEMGVNDAGVAIGNEAVWTREPVQRQGGLTGMDLLRLALERSGSAAEALEQITDFLERYGQGGNCGYRNHHFYYHNSFLIADAREGWVLETAGIYWAARRLTGPYAISNGLTIGETFDRSHPDLIHHARREGHYRSRGEFNFSKAYGEKFYRLLSGCVPRQERNQLAAERADPGAPVREQLHAAFAALRDHGGRTNPLKGLRGTSVCAHAANGLTRDAGQTVGSLVVLLEPDLPPQIWVTATAAPCTSLFKPVVMGETLPPQLGVPGAAADDSSLWWRHEEIHRRLLQDFSRQRAILGEKRDLLERDFVSRWLAASEAQRPELSRDIFAAAESAEAHWRDLLSTLPKAGHSLYWRRKNREAGISA
jgi:secernin